MIKIKTFPIEDAENANKFMLKNPPRSTEKQSGLVFHNGNIVIIYDDGKFNPNDRLGRIRSLLEGERAKLEIVEHSRSVAAVALEQEAPKGWKRGMSQKEFREICAKESGNNEYIPAQMIDQRMGRVEQLDNQILMDTHEVRRMKIEIQAYEKELAESEK